MLRVKNPASDPWLPHGSGQRRMDVALISGYHGSDGSVMRSRLKLSGAILALAAVYVCSGVFGLSMAVVNKSASAVWPPTGVALAALLLYGRSLWPGVFIGAFLVNYHTQGTVLSSIGIATGNTLEALAGLWLVTRFAGGVKAFARTHNFFKYLLVAAFLSTTLSATFGVTSLCLSGFSSWDQYGGVWFTWWLGDMVSNIVVTPLIVLWLTQPEVDLKPAHVLEALGLFVMILLVGIGVFISATPFKGLHPSLEYLAILPVLWAAFRFGERGAISSAVITAALALWATLQGLGPFAQQNPHRSVLLLQIFMGAITLTGLVLALVVSESRRAEQRLQLQGAVSRVLAEGLSLGEAAPKVLEALCHEASWECSALWIRDATANQLACAAFWHVPGIPSIAEFANRTCVIQFDSGLGLPGRVWKSGQPAFIRDAESDPNFPRRPEAMKAGLRSAFAFPLKVGDDIPGVIESFSVRAREPEEELQHLLEAIGSQLGQFLERKQAEVAQARLAAIVESSADAIIGKTLDGVITSWNEGAERMFGYKAAEAIGQTIALVVPPDLQTEQEDILERIRRGERIRSHHTRRLCKDGALIDVSLTVSPIKDASGRIIGASKFARDITEQKKTERALAEAREMLRQHADDLERRVEERTAKLQDTIRSLDAFCYTIAHDLRAPLRAMIGFSLELLDRYEGVLDNEGQDFLKRIRSAGTRMDHLILDLLKLGRLNTADLLVEEVNLGEVFRSVLLDLEGDIKQRQARVELKEPLLWAQGSQVILEQVLSNLISNALKFVAPRTQPQIQIWTEAREGRVRAYVRDNGIGIKPQHLPKLFQPFSRIVNDLDFPGTGIGLAIVSKGVERMGGSAGVESQPGKGSSFWIELAAAHRD